MSGFVLIVDDEEQVRDVLRRKMEQCGFTVSEAHNGKQAIDRLGTEEVDLVISDIMMPERDGLEVIMHLKKTKPEVKVIAISAPGTKCSSTVPRRWERIGSSRNRSVSTRSPPQREN
jgi:CheY-like chemotaxis protein